MTKDGQMISMKKLAVGLATMAAIALIGPGSALAASTTVTGSVNAGNLSFTAASTAGFSGTLDGTDQTKSYSVAGTLTDARGARGSQSGWHLDASQTQFSANSGASTLATNASTITGVTNACFASTTCTSPSNSVTYPISPLPAGASPTPAKYFNAAQDTGKGKFTNTLGIDVFLPANTDAGSYTSTLTLAESTGP